MNSVAQTLVCVFSGLKSALHAFPFPFIRKLFQEYHFMSLLGDVFGGVHLDRRLGR